MAEAIAPERLSGFAEEEEVDSGETFTWIEKNRRMSKDYEKLCASGEAFIYAAMSRLMLRRLART